MNIRARDVGVIPLLVSFPFMYFPKLLGGDTQPWVFVAALIALFTFRTDQFMKVRRDLPLITLSLMCIAVYMLREPSTYDAVRNAYTYMAFIVFWLVSQRESGGYFSIAVKVTVVVWFAVGLYQYLAIKLGYAVYIPGRYLEGRMGPPSLTAEASYYGSISMLHLMYLLTEKGKQNTIYILLSVASIILSGSLLAMVLFVFPLMRLPLKFRLLALIILPIFVVADYYYTSTGVTSRLISIFSDGLSFEGAFRDASLNLRAGHIYYTMYENLIPSLFWSGRTDFMLQYNAFGEQNGLLIPTESNYILPAMGEMIFSSGLFALVLLVFFFKHIIETCETRKDAYEKVAFVIACMLNPISISNIFLIIYATKKVEK